MAERPAPEATTTEEIADALDRLGVRGLRPVAGGDISHAFRATCSHGECFVKCVPGGDPRLLPCEATGLAKLRESFAGVVPEVYFVEARFLVLQWLDLRPRNSSVDAKLGRLLAGMHRRQATEHGWMEDNFIGRSPQRNLARTTNWAEFFIDCRLVPQLRGLHDAGEPEFGDLTDRAADHCARVLGKHTPAPSLLHGDLWGGNAAATADGEPVIFDPACSYGDRETDLAMCRLFGGFSSDFYRAYEDANPLAPGWQSRMPLYQLYYLLNHAALFGGLWKVRALKQVRELASLERRRH